MYCASCALTQKRRVSQSVTYLRDPAVLSFFLSIPSMFLPAAGKGSKVGSKERHGSCYYHVVTKLWWFLGPGLFFAFFWTIVGFLMLCGLCTFNFAEGCWKIAKMFLDPLTWNVEVDWCSPQKSCCSVRCPRTHPCTLHSTHQIPQKCCNFLWICTFGFLHFL